MLSLVLVTILALGFAAPAVVEEYAKEAMVFEPTDLSIDSLTSDGVRARVQGDFSLDALRVHKKPTRDLGRLGTWIARKVESRPSKVEVFLPEYDDLLLGTALVPSIVVDIRNGHTTHVDFITDLKAGSLDGIRRIANDWIDGRLTQLIVTGEAKVGLKSGLFSLGTQDIRQSLVFKGLAFLVLSVLLFKADFMPQGKKYRSFQSTTSPNSTSTRLMNQIRRNSWLQMFL